jgi:flagellar biosynthesis GTPase FlhF
MAHEMNTTMSTRSKASPHTAQSRSPDHLADVLRAGLSISMPVRDRDGRIIAVRDKLGQQAYEALVAKAITSGYARIVPSDGAGKNAQWELKYYSKYHGTRDKYNTWEPTYTQSTDIKQLFKEQPFRFVGQGPPDWLYLSWANLPAWALALVKTFNERVDALGADEARAAREAEDRAARRAQEEAEAAREAEDWAARRAQKEAEAAREDEENETYWDERERQRQARINPILDGSAERAARERAAREERLAARERERQAREAEAAEREARRQEVLAQARAGSVSDDAAIWWREHFEESIEEAMEAATQLEINKELNPLLRRIPVTSDAHEVELEYRALVPIADALLTIVERLTDQVIDAFEKDGMDPVADAVTHTVRAKTTLMLPEPFGPVYVHVRTQPGKAKKASEDPLPTAAMVWSLLFEGSVRDDVNSGLEKAGYEPAKGEAQIQVRSANSLYAALNGAWRGMSEEDRERSVTWTEYRVPFIEDVAEMEDGPLNPPRRRRMVIVESDSDD